VKGADVVVAKVVVVGEEHDELHCDVIGSKTAVPGQV